MAPRALALCFSNQCAKIEPQQLLHILSTCSIPAVIIQAVKLAPFAVATAADVEICLKYMYTTLITPPSRSFTPLISERIQVAIAEALGPLCCVYSASKNPMSSSAARFASARDTDSLQWRCCPKCSGTKTTRTSFISPPRQRFL